MEFKYDGYNFRNFNQRRAAFFADIFRLVLFQPEIPMCRRFIYLLNEVAAEKEGKIPARKANAMYTHLRDNAGFGKMELSTKDNPFHLDQDYISDIFRPTKKNKFRNDFLTRFYGKNHQKNIGDFLNAIDGLDCQLFCQFKTTISKNDFIDKWKIYVFEITR